MVTKGIISFGIKVTKGIISFGIISFGIKVTKGIISCMYTYIYEIEINFWRHLLISLQCYNLLSSEEIANELSG